MDDQKFSDLKLINTKANLIREVATIESTETPDIAKYLAPNTLLLTTAMVFKDNQRDLCDLIVQLNKLPSAGLAIKLGRFIQELDQEVIDTADELGFPLIQIPLNMTLGNIFHKLFSHLWNNQNEELLYSLNTQRRFSNIMIKNTSIDIYPEEDPKTSNIASVYPIKMAGYYPYYLIVFNAKNLKYPLSAMAIEQAIMILAFTLYKNLRVAYSLLSNEEEFFNDIIHSKSYEKLNENQLLFKGEKYKFKDSDFYQVIIATVSNKDGFFIDTSVMEESYTLIYNWLKNKLSKDIEGAILFPNRGKYEYIFLLQKPHDDLINRLTTYRDILHKTLQLNMNYFIGNPVQDIGSIQYSYREALETMEFGESKDNIDFIKYYLQMDTFDLLHLLPKNQIDNFIMNSLKTLAYPKDEMTRDLRNTLKTYLDLNCNITDTANTLYIHRNTVKYRIDRCSDILGQNVSEQNNSLKLRLSLAYTEKHFKRTTSE